jgi:plasmid stability protein
MSTMIQVRNVPDVLHRKLKARAALAGLSLSDYVLAELKRSLDRPTRDEFLTRLAARTRTQPTPRPADLVRAERDAR